MKSITIVVPTFNSIKYITQCMDSVLSQKYENLSILAVDNESTDKTFEYLSSLEDSRLKVISLPNIYPNGYREAIEYITDNVNTDYVSFVCSDDFIAPFYVNKCMNILNKNPDIKCMQSPIYCVNEQGVPNNLVSYSYKDINELKSLLLQKSVVNNPTVIYAKEIWPLIIDGRKAHEANQKEDLGAGDYDMWCSLADSGIFIYSNPTFLGYYYRFHPAQATWIVHKQSFNYNKMIQEYWRNKWTTQKS